MICVSIGEKSVRGCLDILNNFDFAEIRMDMMDDLTVGDISAIFSGPAILIATCRQGRFAEQERKAFLLAAIEAGAGYVDMDVVSDAGFREEIVKRAKEKGCRVIISFHDYDKTPEKTQLTGIAYQCFDQGADIAKIACRVNDPRDNAVLLGLLGAEGLEGRTVVAGMGEKGKMTRIAAPFLGSPFTFAAVSEEKRTADGQIGKDRMEDIMRLLGDA